MPTNTTTTTYTLPEKKNNGGIRMDINMPDEMGIPFSRKPSFFSDAREFTVYYKHGVMNTTKVLARNAAEAKKIGLAEWRKNYTPVDDRFNVDFIVDHVVDSATQENS